jgi:hypothetical protein
VSEPRSAGRRRGRGIDAIFDAADLSLDPIQEEPGASEGRPRDDRNERRGAPGSNAVADPPELRRTSRLEDQDDGVRRLDGARESVRDGASDRLARGTASDGIPRRRRPGRPRKDEQEAPRRELLQRGFYLEPEQDRMLDEIKAALKGRGFTPDRSAIIRAAIEYFHGLDRFDQEDLVRRSK